MMRSADELRRDLSVQARDRVRRPWPRALRAERSAGAAFGEALRGRPRGAATGIDHVQAALIKPDDVGVTGDARAEEVRESLRERDAAHRPERLARAEPHEGAGRELRAQAVELATRDRSGTEGLALDESAPPLAVSPEL